MGFFILGPARVYSEDTVLFETTGLPSFEIDDQEEHYVGTYKPYEDEVAEIKVYVTCMPAHFWRFEIKALTGKVFEISTGSGALSEYWNSAILVANGMLVIKNK